MKRRDLIQKIEQAGTTLIRHGGKTRLVSATPDQNLPARSPSYRNQRVPRPQHPPQTLRPTHSPTCQAITSRFAGPSTPRLGLPPPIRSSRSAVGWLAAYASAFEGQGPRTYLAKAPSLSSSSSRSPLLPSPISCLLIAAFQLPLSPNNR